jgi:hypothetical protein
MSEIRRRFQPHSWILLRPGQLLGVLAEYCQTFSCVLSPEKLFTPEIERKNTRFRSSRRNEDRAPSPAPSGEPIDRPARTVLSADELMGSSLAEGQRGRVPMQRGLEESQGYGARQDCFGQRPGIAETGETGQTGGWN